MNEILIIRHGQKESYLSKRVRQLRIHPSCSFTVEDSSFGCHDRLDCCSISGSKEDNSRIGGTE